jgi:hypothetical protein
MRNIKRKTDEVGTRDRTCEKEDGKREIDENYKKKDGRGRHEGQNM